VTGPPRRVLLGLGSNLGDRRELLRAAVASLDGVMAVSPAYQTEPVGGPSGQGPFLNIVVALETAMPARDLLAECGRLEKAANRVRHERWGPRTLDVDVLWIDGETVGDDDLAVPHPRMRQRAFVMAPLADIAPDVAGPGWADTAEGDVELVGPL
jgi:2-amino-4-hydroxy-6-hydroxymethyldihydropteridine diphosphokinase